MGVFLKKMLYLIALSSKLRDGCTVLKLLFFSVLETGLRLRISCEIVDKMAPNDQIKIRSKRDNSQVSATLVLISVSKPNDLC